MRNLHRELAPISESAWGQIEEEAHLAPLEESLTFFAYAAEASVPLPVG
jgi:hypothetical protein